VSAAAILDGIDVLVSGSLLYRPVAVGHARFAMLEVIREFALEQLATCGEAEDTARRHADYFCQLAQSIEPHLSQDPGGTSPQQLGVEADNLRSVLRYALEADEPDLGLELASCMWRYWQSRDQLSEGRDWLEQLLVHPGASDAARARGHAAQAGLAYWQADYDGAMAEYEAAFALYRSIGDRHNEAEILASMSMTANWREDIEAAERLAGEARSLFEDLGSREGIGKIHLAQGFSLFRRNQVAAAQEEYEASLVIARDVGDQPMASTLLLGIAVFTFHQGMRREGLRILLDAVDETATMHNTHLTVWMLGFAAAMAASAAPEEAARLASAAEALRREAGGGMLPESLGLEDAISAAARTLTPRQLEQAQLQGTAMNLEQAISQARRLEARIPDLEPHDGD
jgi:tetratricopeptide (TPR) repeat protein